ncbi:unnamed protein product [Calypogeia fissa]
MAVESQDIRLILVLSPGGKGMGRVHHLPNGGHISSSCPMALAAKTMLMSMGGATAKTTAATNGVVHMISIANANDKASDNDEWEHESKLPQDLSQDEESCFKVSTISEKRKKGLRSLKISESSQRPMKRV